MPHLTTMMWAFVTAFLLINMFIVNSKLIPKTDFKSSKITKSKPSMKINW